MIQIRHEVLMCAICRIYQAKQSCAIPKTSFSHLHILAGILMFLTEYHVVSHKQNCGKRKPVQYADTLPLYTSQQTPTNLLHALLVRVWFRYFSSLLRLWYVGSKLRLRLFGEAAKREWRFNSSRLVHPSAKTGRKSSLE